MNAPVRTYPIPANDIARTRMIEAMDLTARQDDPFFEHVTDLAKRTFGTPIAFLSLIGGETQCLLHCDGADIPDTPRQMSLCAFTVAAKQTIVLHDTHLDPRSVNHPIVTGGFQIRFSASAPVILSSGFCLGTLCAVDMVPHDPPTAEQIATLESLAAMTARFYEAPSEPSAADAEAMSRIVEDAQAEFLTLIGHELRTPLNGIYGMAQFLDRSDETAAELATAITSAAELLNDVVENILTFTELKSGDIELADEPLDLARLLRPAPRRWRRRCGSAARRATCPRCPKACPSWGTRPSWSWPSHAWRRTSWRTEARTPPSRPAGWTMAA